jgi:uncharacterized membrane protein
LSSDILYALAALACNGLCDLIYKRAAGAGFAANQFLMAQAWFFCPAIVAYAAVTGTLDLRLAAIWGGFAGLFILIGLYNYSRSLRAGSISVVAPIFRLNFIVTAALAIGWLHEPLTTQKLIGFLLALIAGWLLLGSPRPRGSADPTTARHAFVQVFVATAAMGAANFCYKLGLLGGATPETLLAAQAVVFCSLATATTYLIHGSIRPPAGFAAHSGPAAIALLAAFLFLLHGLKHGEATVVVPIAQMGFVVAALVGSLFFKEVWTARKVAGLSAAIAALALLAIV